MPLSKEAYYLGDRIAPDYENGHSWEVDSMTLALE